MADELKCYLDFTSLLWVVNVVESLLYGFPQSNQAMVPQNKHLQKDEARYNNKFKGEMNKWIQIHEKKIEVKTTSSNTLHLECSYTCVKTPITTVSKQIKWQAV